MQDPAIPAVIALYSGVEFIEDALDSVFVRTRAPVQTIVVDDGSTDHRPEIVARLAKTHDIRLLRKPNRGQSAARNLGIAHAATLLVALPVQDDMWYPHHLEQLVIPFHADRHPEPGWIYSNLDEVDREGKIVTRGLLVTFPGVEHPKRTLNGCIASDSCPRHRSSAGPRSTKSANPMSVWSGMRRTICLQ